jgi:hypothetical protein
MGMKKPPNLAVVQSIQSMQQSEEGSSRSEVVMSMKGLITLSNQFD